MNATLQPDRRVAVIDVPVTGLWRSPDAPRLCDSALVSDQPDHGEWLACLDDDDCSVGDRDGLLDRLDSEVLHHEPVVVVDEPGDGWLQVRCPWQPTDGSDTGYLGYVRAVHTKPATTSSPAALLPASNRTPSREAFLATARGFVGLPYLWGGLSPAGVDCSGLVHYALRTLGVVVGRDACDQLANADVVPVEQALPGDLYFFAKPDAPVHHVGIVTGELQMLHAPSFGVEVVEEPLLPARMPNLRCAARLPGLE